MSEKRVEAELPNVEFLGYSAYAWIGSEGGGPDIDLVKQFLTESFRRAS